MLQKFFIYLLSIGTFLQSCAQEKPKKENNMPQKNKSIYDFKVKNLEGEIIDFSTFKGKKILIVNTASECGFTPQYADLEKLYQTYKDQLVIVGFPANNFGSQEPGSNKEIASFCKKNYGVTFPMAEKVSVKGDDMAPIFQFLTQKELNGVKNTTILWNFTKFLIDENGKLLDTFISTTSPTDKAITEYFKK